MDNRFVGTTVRLGRVRVTLKSLLDGMVDGSENCVRPVLVDDILYHYGFLMRCTRLLRYCTCNSRMQGSQISSYDAESW